MVTITVAHQVEVWGGRAMLGVIITQREIYCNTFIDIFHVLYYIQLQTSLELYLQISYFCDI